MRKILLMSGLSKGGGAERVLSILANDFSDNGYSVVFSSFYNNGYYPLNNKVKKKVFNSSNKLLLLYDIRRYVRLNKFDVVICFMYPISYTLCIALLGMRNKPFIISSERSDPSKPTHHKIEKYLRIWSYNSSNHVVFQTEQARNYFKNSLKRKTSIIENPISDNLPEPYKGIRKKNIIAIGRLTEQKNFELLIRVFLKISKEYKEYRLDIFGEGPLKSRLESLICELSLNEVVTIHDFTDDIYNILNESGMYISCSNYEGISNTMLEALALGVPSICTDCPVGGAKMNIVNEKNGLLIDVNNEIQLYNAIKKLITNKEYSKVFSDNYHMVRDRLSVKNVGGKWIDLIESFFIN